MSILHKIDLGDGTEGRAFHCPGCEYSHWVRVTGQGAWGFNGNEEKPTFTPSVLVNASGDSEIKRCHSFVKDGKIQFLGDCDHSLKNQTVDLPDMDNI